MTYSHNSVSKNLKMTTAATAAAAASVRLKNETGEAGKASGDDGGISPPSTPPISAHSNSIASNSTNFHYHHQPMLSCSPPGSNMSSAMSTSSNSSISSSVSSLSSNSNGSNSNGYYATMRKQQRQSQQQRRSPHHQNSNDCGSYFNNVNNQQPSSGGKRYGVGCISLQKNRETGQRSPQNDQQSVRQSPASILGGGISMSPIATSSGGSNSARKSRSKHTSPLLCLNGGKISPTHPLIPTALTHFAGSKCFDAPAPTALPKPPEHWTGSKSSEKAASSAGLGLQSIFCGTAARSHHIHFHHLHGYAHDSHSYGGHVVKSSKRNLLDDFDTHNLKLLLNVQS